jgi:hypothetical protein
MAERPSDDLLMASFRDFVEHQTRRHMDEQMVVRQ